MDPVLVARIRANMTIRARLADMVKAIPPSQPTLYAAVWSALQVARDIAP